MNQQPFTLDGMAFYKLWREKRDQGAPSYTLDSITNFAQPGKVEYKLDYENLEKHKADYSAYHEADAEITERAARFRETNPNATFIEALTHLLPGVRFMTKETFQSPKPKDIIDLSDEFRMTLIPNSDEIPVAHVATITTIEELCEDRTDVLNVFPVQAAFTIDKRLDGEWVQLQEADFTETMYGTLKPLIEAEHRRGCEAHGTAFDQRMTPEYVHVPIIGHRKGAAELMNSLSNNRGNTGGFVHMHMDPADPDPLKEKAKIFTDAPLEQTEYQAKSAE